VELSGTGGQLGDAEIGKWWDQGGLFLATVSESCDGPRGTTAILDGEAYHVEVFAWFGVGQQFALFEIKGPL